MRWRYGTASTRADQRGRSARTGGRARPEPGRAAYVHRTPRRRLSRAGLAFGIGTVNSDHIGGSMLPGHRLRWRQSMRGDASGYELLGRREVS